MSVRWTDAVTFGAVAVLLAVGVGGGARADSLFKADKPSIYTDRKAAKVGDLITIIIVENSSASQQANTAVSTSNKVSAGPGAGPILHLIPGLQFSGGTDTKNTGSTSRTANLAARITAKVTEIKPNGDLVIEGSRDVKANDETQILKISGQVRPDDVAPDNTVQSTFVADAKIEYTGKGVIAEKQKPGLVTRIFKLLF
jgi:flagellar L-ring protein precursor FlgH